MITNGQTYKATCPTCGGDVYGFTSVVATTGGQASTTQYQCGTCKRLVVPVWKTLLILLAMLVGQAQAQALDVTTQHGRVFNIATGEWAVASVPGFEFCAANLTLSGSWWFDVRRGYFEQDWSLAWAKTWRERFTLTVTGAANSFRDLGTDRIWLVETRYRVFGRH